MKVSFKRTNQALVNLMLLETILRHTSLSKLLKRKKSSKDMVMNLMESYVNVRKKSRLLPTPLTTSR